MDRRRRAGGQDPAGIACKWLMSGDWLTAGALLVATLLCWAWIVPMARDMYGTMTGSSAWMMAGVWDFTHLALLFAMWVVMMAGMMLPSAAPIPSLTHTKSREKLRGSFGI